MRFGTMLHKLVDGGRARAANWPKSQWLEIKDKQLMHRKDTGDYAPLLVTTGDIAETSWAITEE